MNSKFTLSREVLTFAAVGIINTLVGTGIMFFCYNAIGLSYWLSSALNYFLTSILSYVLNKHFTFKATGKGIFYLIRFTLNIALCYLIAYGFAKPLAFNLFSSLGDKLCENIAMLIGMGFFVFLNFFGQKFFVFRNKSNEN